PRSWDADPAASASSIGAPPSAFLAGPMGTSLLQGVFDDEPAAAVASIGPAPNPPWSPRTTSDGLWRRCYEGFTARGASAERVLTRLSLLCGPITGLSKQDRRAGTATPGTPGRATWLLPARSCHRVFLATDEAAGDVRVSAQWSPPHAPLELGAGLRWVVLEPARPICVEKEANLTVRVQVRGEGRFVAELWSAPAN
ncbi:MAG: hypothetical protein AAGA56_19825, partial [Myxococcota bacterium]